MVAKPRLKNTGLMDEAWPNPDLVVENKRSFSDFDFISKKKLSSVRENQFYKRQSSANRQSTSEM
jgi:hypothetical protein